MISDRILVITWSRAKETVKMSEGLWLESCFSEKTSIIFGAMNILSRQEGFWDISGGQVSATIAGGHHTLPSTKQLTTRMASSGRNIPAKAWNGTCKNSEMDDGWFKRVLFISWYISYY